MWQAKVMHWLISLSTFYAGEHNLREHSSFEQRRELLEVHVHPLYNRRTVDYDLALLKLKQRVQLNAHVRTACLFGEDFPVGTNCTITGWGDLVEGGSGPAVSNYKCRVIAV